MNIRRPTPSDLPEWLRMRQTLWPDDTAAHEREMAEWLSREDRAIFVCEADSSGLCGFVEAGERSYASGCESSPVAYFEGWWVDPTHRRRGVGRALYAAVEEWARSRGHTELASDAVLDNAVSHRAHASAGFEEVERVVQYRKRL